MISLVRLMELARSSDSNVSSAAFIAMGTYDPSGRWLHQPDRDEPDQCSPFCTQCRAERRAMETCERALGVGK